MRDERTKGRKDEKDCWRCFLKSTVSTSLPSSNPNITTMEQSSRLNRSSKGILGSTSGLSRKSIRRRIPRDCLFPQPVWYTTGSALRFNGGATAPVVSVRQAISIVRCASVPPKPFSKLPMHPISKPASTRFRFSLFRRLTMPVWFLF